MFSCILAFTRILKVILLIQLHLCISFFFTLCISFFTHYRFRKLQVMFDVLIDGLAHKSSGLTYL